MALRGFLDFRIFLGIVQLLDKFNPAMQENINCVRWCFGLLLRNRHLKSEVRYHTYQRYQNIIIL